MKIVLIEALSYENEKKNWLWRPHGWLIFNNMSNNIRDEKRHDFKLVEEIEASNPKVSLYNFKNCPNYAKLSYKLDASFNSNEKIDSLNFYKGGKLILKISNNNGKYLFKTYNREGVAKNLSWEINKDGCIFQIYIDSKYFSLI